MTGVVQGVGFRPFVHDLATRLGLSGYVRNETSQVRIEVEGDIAVLEQFLTELRTNQPPLARIEKLRAANRTPRGEAGFRIERSEALGAGPVYVAADVATCDDCRRELFDPRDRRYRYPFTNCTNCGPRLTIVTGAPYDRACTTMAAFAMCAACRAEYDDASNRRFHAQPIACPGCGPRLHVFDGDGLRIATSDPLAHVVAALQDGRIVAVKGLGGYHLACDAQSEAAVGRLRRRKRREAKPFAVMVGDIAAAEALGAISERERELLLSPPRPIVLLKARGSARVAAGVAPGIHVLGVMLPYTPLHHLLICDLGGSPLVMTSGNRSDEPIAYDDADAHKRLAGIADLWLSHDRAIHVRCDDSVARVAGRAPIPIRRSRGYAPQPLSLSHALTKPTLATGGHLKATFAVGRGVQAFVSHHVGDLGDYEAYRAYATAIAHYERLFRITPQRIVHDLHPDYASSRYAVERARRAGLDLVPVQHHHAHMASCMAEHGLDAPVLGVCFDGAGLGPDGTIWGGEFLLGGYRQVRRVAHLAPVPMPGGERAIREPWRMAVAHLVRAGESHSPLTNRIGSHGLRTVERMLERGFNAPQTSSVGRLFDAVAALIGVGDHVTFEGEAAMRLEALAAGAAADESYPMALVTDGDRTVVEPAPLVRAIIGELRAGVAPALIARRFHSTLVMTVVTVCDRVRAATRVGTVVLSGGVFVNEILTREVDVALTAVGFDVYRHHTVPPNDGGISLGQLAIAAAHDDSRDGAPR